MLICTKEEREIRTSTLQRDSKINCMFSPPTVGIWGGYRLILDLCPRDGKTQELG